MFCKLVFEIRFELQSTFPSSSVQSLAKPASPLLQAQKFNCATQIRDSLHVSNHIRSSALVTAFCWS